MLLKWIVCTIAPEKRELFSESQAKWEDVRHVPGFLGQLGGWNVKDPSEACILAFWENEEMYKEFMEKHHDPIYEKTNQRGTFDAIKVTACRSIADIPGLYDHILPSLPNAALLRLADQTLLAGHRDRFLAKQQDIWNPGMKQSGGMLAGVLGEALNDTNRVLVATLWDSEAAHPTYCDNTLPLLREKARIEENIEQISGRVVRLEPSWFV